MIKMPKTIVNHPAVESCEYGPNSGVEDYKYDIFLKDGFVFANGKAEGCRSFTCNTVADFLHANPVTVEEYRRQR
jgi:hypothetical protein